MENALPRRWDPWRLLIRFTIGEAIFKLLIELLLTDITGSGGEEGTGRGVGEGKH